MFIVGNIMFYFHITFFFNRLEFGLIASNSTVSQTLMFTHCEQLRTITKRQAWLVLVHVRTQNPLGATKVNVRFIVKIHAVRTFFSRAVGERKIHPLDA